MDLQGCLESWALARWPADALLDALASVADREPAAARLLAWLEHAARQSATHATGAAPAPGPRSFNDALGAAGFNQRNQAWIRASTSASIAGSNCWMNSRVWMPCWRRSTRSEALGRLRQLAATGRHQASSGDAAITLDGELGDPLIAYDGIWVLGLAESRWPAPPRPDAYVALQEQRVHHWPEASVTERRVAGAWALSRWQRRTAQLILSYPEMEGDLHHRPTGVARASTGRGMERRRSPCRHRHSLELAAAAHTISSFPPFPAAALGKPLPGGAERLRIQQHVPISRAGAVAARSAMAAGPLSDGLTAADARHAAASALLQRVWEELQDQAQLLALDAATPNVRCWNGTGSAVHRRGQRRRQSLVAAGACASASASGPWRS